MSVYIYKGLKDEQVPEDVIEVIIAEGVTKIHYGAFRIRKQLKTIRNFPLSLTEFSYIDGKVELSLPFSQIRNVGRYAFYGCAALVSFIACLS